MWTSCIHHRLTLAVLRNIADVEEDLAELLPPLPFQQTHITSDDVIPADSIHRIAKALRTNARTRPWCSQPRLYTLLRVAGWSSDELLEAPFINRDRELEDGLSDYCIPFERRPENDTLSSLLKRWPRRSRKLLEVQDMVLSNSKEIAFEDAVQRELHKSFTSCPFDSIIPVRASGAIGRIARVRNTEPRAGPFVLKCIPRKGIRSVTPEQAESSRNRSLKIFQNELGVLRRLRELDLRHVVRFCGSYTDRTNFALLFQPVAECSLYELLAEHDPLKDNLPPYISESFGCLPAALEWLHIEAKIKHRDIKPANILVVTKHQGPLVFCDFGSALYARTLDCMATDGPSYGRTHRYSAPETTNPNLSRDEASDTWSLGTVFAEMLTVLSGQNLSTLERYLHERSKGHRFSFHGDISDICYWMYPEHLISWIDEIMSATSNGDAYGEPAAWTKKMVSTLLASDPRSDP